MPTVPSPRLPTVAVELLAALTPAADQLGEQALGALTTATRANVTKALTEIGDNAARGAAALLLEADPVDDRIGELLTVRAWLLAVACGAGRLAGPNTVPSISSDLTSTGARLLRDRYNNDLAGGYADGVLPLIDDLLEM